MTLLDELADFIFNLSFERLDREVIEQAQLHLFDSLGALLAGANTMEGKAVREWMQRKSSDDLSDKRLPSGLGLSPPPVLLGLCVATRLTEIDDIDLSSCTTPGAVVVPSALGSALSTRASGRKILEAVVAGYDVMTRLGAAIDGPEILYRGLWPTYLCGPAGAAAVSSKILGLTSGQTAEALAISLSLTSGLAGRISARLTSRWITLGLAVQNGLYATLAAERGFCGDRGILEGSFISALGLTLKRKVLLDGLGKDFKVGKVGLKPYCTARQALAPVEAFRALLSRHRFDPEAIEAIEVLVPEPYSRMIDKSQFPVDRLGSITGVQYQLALAAFFEEDLFDIDRQCLRDEKKVHGLMKKVSVKSSGELTAMFPERWPGRISVRVGGHTYEHEVLTPKGDPGEPLMWQDVEQKVKLVFQKLLAPVSVDDLREGAKHLSEAQDSSELTAIMRFIPF